MTSLAAASDLRSGSGAVSAVYKGSTKVWPVTHLAVTAGASTSGTVASNATTATITLPTWTTGDYLLLVVSRNQSDGTAWVGDSSASITTVAHTGRRLSALSVTPTTGATTFVVTAAITALWSWCCINLGQSGPTASTATANDSSGTTSAVAFPAVTMSPATAGNELVLALAGANSTTGTWTAPSGSTTIRSSTAAPGLLVASYVPSSGLTTVQPADADRGLGGTARNESSITLVMRGAVG